PTAFTDDMVGRPDIVALRDRVSATADPACHEASVDIDIVFDDGSKLHKRIERAIGSRERPLTDDQLNVKFLNQSEPVVGAEQSRRLLDMSWAIESLNEAADLAEEAAAQRISTAAE
ncbi:MAG TPA: MmgE/PrpD family protein, partial [Aurantimonas coralicida]|nr:MmgE/PrpD family protein [Aurantimonas coralicida]